MNGPLANLPKALTALPQWVCVREGSKIPMQAARERPASSADPATWASFDAAAAAAQQGRYQGVGFVFRGNGIVGIDIDDGYKSAGVLSDAAAYILPRMGSYAERSRSGRGFHILVRGQLPFAGKNNLRGVEIYQEGRYFIMTGDVLPGYAELRENQPAIDDILARFFPEDAGPGRGGASSGGSGGSRGSGGRAYAPVWDVPANGKIPLRPGYPAILEGGRNLSLASLAGQLSAAGCGQHQIMAELLWVNRAACMPPLPDREVRAIARSISRYRRGCR